MNNRTASIFTWTVTVTVPILLAIVFWLQQPVARDVFLDQKERALLTVRRATDVQAAKLAHAKAVPRYQTGIFGNSRSVNVSRNDITGLSGTYFNFSVPGTSFRSSVLMLEQMAIGGIAPKVALVSLDNLALEFFGPALFPNTLPRYQFLVTETGKALFAENPSRRQALKAAWRQAWQEWILLKEVLNWPFFENRWFRSPDMQHAYRQDGSIQRDFPGRGTTVFAPHAVPVQQIAIDVLIADILRLAVLKSKYGIDVIVYESPLHPTSIPTCGPAPQYRSLIVGTCKDAELKCYLASTLPQLDEKVPWSDSNHAPATELGRFLTGILIGKVPDQ